MKRLALVLAIALALAITGCASKAPCHMQYSFTGDHYCTSMLEVTGATAGVRIADLHLRNVSDGLFSKLANYQE